MRKKLLICAFLLCGVFGAKAQTYTTVENISYVEANETDAYRLERCKVDLYMPQGVKDFPTIVWYHGGGLESGQKEIPQYFKENGFAVVGVNYRLYPKVKNPGYIEDAAQALAWTFKHIAEYGGNPDKIFVSGHSAGGYLALILATDKKWLANYGADADKVKAYLPVSGQTVTHFTIRKERGLPNGIPIIDEYAPVNKTRKDTAPIYLITGGRDLEMADRWEENALFASVSKNIGNPNVTLRELEGFDHVSVLGPACLQIVDYIKKACPESQPLRLAQMPGLEQPAFAPARAMQPQGQTVRNLDEQLSNFTPTFLVYPDKKPANAAEANAIIQELGLRDYMKKYAAQVIISGPVGDTYNAQADLAAYEKLFNSLRAVGNLKVIGLGAGATFVNQSLAAHAQEVAGIFTYGGKAGSYKAAQAAPVPAFVAGATAKQVAKLYIEQNAAKATGATGAFQYYKNAEEPLQQVVVSAANYPSAASALTDAWEQLLSKNYRFNNYKHTWYTGAKLNEFGPYELEPTVLPGHAGVERTIKLIDIPGKTTKYLWFEYFPKGTADADKPAEKSIPLMILLHGNTNDPRTQAETSGFIELAAEEGFAVAELEWQGNGYEAMGLDGVESTISQILAAHPQLDPSRVYAQGLSAGSFTATTLGIHGSYLFAAVGGNSGGLFPGGGVSRFGASYDMLVQNARQKSGRVEMPYCSICGTDDEVVVFPKEGKFEQSSIYWAWKAYQILNNLPETQGLDFSKDATFGLTLQNRQHLETNKHISMETGELLSAKGTPLIKMVAVNNYGHWNFKPAARVMWDYYKHFQRNTQTGELIYNK